MNSEQQERWPLVLLAIGFEGSLAGLAWGLGWLFGEPPLKHFSWKVHDAVWGVVASLPLLIVFVLMLQFPVGPLARIKRIFDEIVRPRFVSCTLLDLAGISLVAGIGEEVLFRGVLQPLLARGLGMGSALILTSILFGLLHPITTSYVVIAAVFGVYLGSLYLASENLLVVVVTHAIYDFLALGYLVKRHSS